MSRPALSAAAAVLKPQVCRRARSRPYLGPGNKLWKLVVDAKIVTPSASTVIQALLLIHTCLTSLSRSDFIMCDGKAPLSCVLLGANVMRKSMHSRSAGFV